MTRETVYSKFTELTPEIIDKITQKCHAVVNGTDEAGADALCNETIPSGWVRRVVRMHVKSAVVDEVALTLYTGTAATHLQTVLDRYYVANLSALPLETEDAREGLYSSTYNVTTLTQLYGIVDANSTWVTTWYYDWPW